VSVLDGVKTSSGGNPRLVVCCVMAVHGGWFSLWGGDKGLVESWIAVLVMWTPDHGACRIMWKGSVRPAR
jgi:hypothetical protein